MLPGSGNTCVLFCSRRKGAQKNQPVVVALKFRPFLVAPPVEFLLPEPLSRYQLMPIHIPNSFFLMYTFCMQGKDTKKI
jgi:hypothetical protein